MAKPIDTSDFEILDITDGHESLLELLDAFNRGPVLAVPTDSEFWVYTNNLKATKADCVKWFEDTVGGSDDEDDEDEDDDESAQSFERNRLKDIELKAIEDLRLSGKLSDEEAHKRSEKANSHYS